MVLAEKERVDLRLGGGMAVSARAFVYGDTRSVVPAPASVLFDSESVICAKQFRHSPPVSRNDDGVQVFLLLHQRPRLAVEGVCEMNHVLLTKRGWRSVFGI